MSFIGLNKYGNYEDGKLPEGMVRIPRDGSLRRIKKLGIPYVEIVSVENAYRNHWFPVCTGYAIHAEDKERLDAVLAKSRTPKPHPDLLQCIRESSRAAHRERDAAQAAYQAGRHTLAGNCRMRKEHWYALKDRGIVGAHKRGLLRYLGASPQGLAVYEYGDGGMSCFHSTLHPAGADRLKIDGHPEILQVAPRDKVKGVSLDRVEVTLMALPCDFSGYERSESPAIKRAPRETICYECGEPGHIAALCPLSHDEEMDQFMDELHQ